MPNGRDFPEIRIEESGRFEAERKEAAEKIEQGEAQSNKYFSAIQREIAEIIRENYKQFKAAFCNRLIGCQKRSECFEDAVSDLLVSASQCPPKNWDTKTPEQKAGYILNSLIYQGIDNIKDCVCLKCDSYDDPDSGIDKLIIVNSHEEIEKQIEIETEIDFLTTGLTDEEGILIASIMEEWSSQETALRIGTTPESARKRKQRLLEKLREKKRRSRI